MNSVTASEPAPTRTKVLSEQLDELRQRFQETPATLGEVVGALEGRAYALLMVIFALPFSMPVSVPGSSTPLGLIIAAIALQLAFGRVPWLPRRLLAWKLPPGFFTKLIPVTARLVRSLERGLHPRWLGWTNTPAVRALHLLTIAAAALLLSLPIFIPLTNTIPGWAILLLAFGLLERDGFFIFGGHLVFAATVVYFLVIGSAIAGGLLHTWHWIAG